MIPANISQSLKQDDNPEQSRQSTYAQQIKIVIKLLSIQCSSRTQHQAKVIMEFFEEHFEYIKLIKGRLNEETNLKFYQNMRIELHDKNSVVFNIGDTGRKMYFILEGEVALLIPTQKIIESESRDSIFNIPNKTRMSFIDLVKQQRFRLLLHKKQFDHFGEIAIEQRIPRTATVVTRTDCVFGIVTYDQYQKVLALYKEHITNQRVQFLEQIPPFKYWNQSALSMLLHSSEDVQFDTNAIIYKKNTVGDSIYIIVQGEIFIQKWDKVKNEGELSEHLISRNYKVTTLGVYSSGQIVGDYELYLTNLKQSKVIRLTQATTKQITKVIKIPIAQYLETIQQTAYSEWMIDYLDKKYTKRWIKTNNNSPNKSLSIQVISPQHTKRISLMSPRQESKIDNTQQFSKRISVPELSIRVSPTLQQCNKQIIAQLRKKVESYHDSFQHNTYLGLTIDSPKTTGQAQLLKQSLSRMTSPQKQEKPTHYLSTGKIPNSQHRHYKFNSVNTFK